MDAWNADDAWLDGDTAFYQKAERIQLEVKVLREQVRAAYNVPWNPPLALSF